MRWKLADDEGEMEKQRQREISRKCREEGGQETGMWR